MTAGLELLSDTGEGRALARLCESVLSDFIADPARNNMGPGRTDPAWEGFLLGFGAGDDPLWDELKSVVGPEQYGAGQD
jgi:hypothetical protein